MAASSAVHRKPFVLGIQCLSRENDVIFEWMSYELDDSAKDRILASFEVALDTVDEKIGGGHGPTLERAKGDPYLGLLATGDGVRVYGRAGSTRTVLVAAKDINVDAKIMRECTDAIHVAYVEALCNPFVPVDTVGGAASVAASPLLLKRAIAIAHLTAPGAPDALTAGAPSASAPSASAMGSSSTSPTRRGRPQGGGGGT